MTPIQQENNVSFIMQTPGDAAADSVPLSKERRWLDFPFGYVLSKLLMNF